MRRHYVKYLTSSGKVLQLFTMRKENVALQTLNAGEAIIEVPERGRGYFIDVSGAEDVVSNKTASPHTINKTTFTADGVDMVTISGLHNPTTVMWPDGERTEVIDGVASFTIDLAGDYTVELEAIPYLKEVINVTAIDPS